MKVLVTGGAGYIGSHVAKVFKDNQHDVVVLDDLSNSNKLRVDALDVEFIESSISDRSALNQVLPRIDLVIHCAAYKSVEESESNPDKYFDTNLTGTKVLVQEMLRNDKKEIIFASSAAVYGNAQKSPIREDGPAKPVSVYGETKLAAENLLAAFVAEKNLRAISLRFFNAVGAAKTKLADTSSDNLFPKVFSALKTGNAPQIYGADYPTIDGTCIRDYIHVVDIAEAHLASAMKIKSQSEHKIYNVGTGVGYSVKQIIEGIQKATGIVTPIDVTARRKGDLDIAFADTTLIEREIGWKARFGLDQMISSAWDAWSGIQK
jgi:UDP-glucose 4-epimerase